MRTDYEIWKDISSELKRQAEISGQFNDLVYEDGKLDENTDSEAVLSILKKDIESRQKTQELFEELHSIRNRFKVKQAAHSGLRR